MRRKGFNDKEIDETLEKAAQYTNEEVVQKFARDMEKETDELTIESKEDVGKPVPIEEVSPLGELTNEDLAKTGVNDKNYKKYLDPQTATEAEYVTAKQIQQYKEKGDILPIETAQEFYRSSKLTKAQAAEEQKALPQNLATEAKKYKTAEEFVKAQKSLYHGTGTSFEQFDAALGGSITGAKSAQDTIFFTDNPDVARAYAVYAAERGPVKKLMDESDKLERLAQIAQKEGQKEKADKLFDEMDKVLVEAEKADSYDETFKRRELANVKEVTLSGDFYEVDAKGKTPQELSKEGDIDSWLNQQIEEAKRLGKDGAVFHNLDDAIGLFDVPSTHYAVFSKDSIKTKSQLTNIWNKANKEVADTETKTRGLAKGVESKAIENKLTEGLGDLPQYQTMNMKEQASKAQELLTEDYEKAKSIAMGEETPPADILPESVFVAVENKAINEGDVTTLRNLAVTSELTAEATAMGQRIRTLAERDPESPVTAIKEVSKAREESAKKRSKKKKLKTQVKEDVADIKKEIKKVSTKKQEWIDFVKSLEC